MFLALLAALGQQSPQRRTNYTAVRRHQIPGDDRGYVATYEHKDWKYARVFLVYGATKSLDIHTLQPPAEDGVYVVDPQFGFHRTSATYEDLAAPDLYESALWRDELYPMLKKHVWAAD